MSSIMTTRQLVEAFNKTRMSRIYLTAGENLLSSDQRMALASDLSGRYATLPDGQRAPGSWPYPDQNRIMSELIRHAQIMACDLFHGTQSSVMPVSGLQPTHIILSALLRPGDSFLSIGGNAGGHFSTDMIAANNNYQRVNIPYENGRLNIDRVVSEMKRTSAKLVFLDASMICLPHPVRELRQALGNEAIISYDASHPFGIIAGGHFQSPLEEGADFIHGSTHKSLPGPQKGIIVARQDSSKHDPTHKVFKNIMGPHVVNPHPHHIAALAIALEEMSLYGAHYAPAVIENAKTLAQTLRNRGLDIAFADQGYTQCHQVIVTIGDKNKTNAAFKALDDAHINTNPVTVPFTNGTLGLRLGAAEITRRGMSPKTAEIIAHLAADVLQDARPLNDIRTDVTAIAAAHPHVFYCHDNPVPTHYIAPALPESQAHWNMEF